MAKNSVFDYDATAANNTDIASIPIDGAVTTPSQVDNIIREMMAQTGEFVDDLGGVNTVGGTANAITITAKSGYTALATGLVLSFKASATNTGATTVNVNSIGAKAIRKFTNEGDIALAAGDIIASGLYLMVYDAAANSAAGAWILLNANPDNSKAPTTTVHTATAASTAIPTGATHFSIKAVGGGGAGGGVDASGGGAGIAGAGGGGGAGGYGETDIVAIAAGVTTYAVTIGAGGSGSVAAAGGDGGDTIVTVGSKTLTCTGGTGGPVASVSSQVIGWIAGAGGTATGAGGVQATSGSEYGGIAVSGPFSSTGGSGGSGPWGRGGAGQRYITAQAQTGNSASGYGSGGGGAANFASVNNRAGGNGAAGRVEITFYYRMV